MPNWCCNKVIVTGPKKALDAFKATLNEVIEFSFKQTVPTPANYFSGNLGSEEKKMCEEKGLVDWYSWNSANWGTKWDACEVNLTTKPKSVEVGFDTAWAPPLAWLAGASKAHPKLKFHMGYCGEAIAQAGEVADECQDFPGDVYDDDGEMIEGTVIHKFTEKWAIGTGG
jgi:hypothetical protein